MREILVTGGGGQLGRELQRHAWPDRWSIVATTSAELDLRDPGALATKVAERPWAAVINAAAYTAVDRAETEVVAAWGVNALGPAALAAACRDAGVPIVHVSTDYVFDGEREGAWREDDRPRPLGVYGASKLGGELAVASAGGRYAIVRTAWVISANGSNFVKTMLRLAADRDVVRVVADQHGAPTSAADLAAALATIAMRLAEDDAAPSGTYHFSNAGRATWFELAAAVFEGSARRGAPACVAEPIATIDYPTPARRPRNSLLAHDAIRRDYGVEPRAWRVALDDILDELIGRPR